MDKNSTIWEGAMFLIFSRRFAKVVLRLNSSFYDDKKNTVLSWKIMMLKNNKIILFVV